jgi:hypothetical protein
MNRTRQFIGRPPLDEIAIYKVIVFSNFNKKMSLLQPQQTYILIFIFEGFINGYLAASFYRAILHMLREKITTDIEPSSL